MSLKEVTFLLLLFLPLNFETFLEAADNTTQSNTNGIQFSDQ